MVRVHKIMGDFSLAQIRESFMRQFSTPQLNLVMDTQESTEEQSYIKTPQVCLVRSPEFGTRSGGYIEKQVGVSSVIR